MKVYHSSTVKVEYPDTAHSRSYLDFGRGFYLTTIREQAVKYAERFLRRGSEAWLNTYEMIYNHGKYCVLTIMMGHGLILWQVAEEEKISATTT